MKWIYITGAIIILLFVGVFAITNFRDNRVEVEIISDTLIINQNLNEWIDSKDGENGIHIYVVDNPDAYEAIIYHNIHQGKNRYVYTELSATLEGDILILDYQDIMAQDDQYVRDSLIVKLILGVEPKSIETFHNKANEDYTVQNE